MHFRCGGEAHGDEFGCCEGEGVSLACSIGARGIGLPSANIFVAFCSDMPLICSSTLLGLCDASVKTQANAIQRHARICHRLDGVEPSINHELDVPS